MNGIKTEAIYNLVADPKVRTTPAGLVITDVRLANNYSFRKKGAPELQSKPVFINATAFGSRGEKMATLKKGAQILVEGRLDQESWTAKDQTKHTTYKIVVDAVRVLNPTPKAKA